MATCNQTTVIVAGAGLASVNGTYISAGTEVVGDITFTRYTKDGDANSVPVIRVEYNEGPGFYAWRVDQDIPEFGIQPIYGGDYGLSVPDCPTAVTFAATDGPWGGSTYLPAPTVSSGGSPTPSISPQQRRIINLRKQLKLGGKRSKLK
jgi:hypothetical protein